MNREQEMTCEDSEFLLVKKITGELLSKEKQPLEGHLAQCAFCVAKERELATQWQRFDSLPAPEIPTALYEKTRETILGHLRREKSLFPWAGRNAIEGTWPLLAPFMAGLVMTGVSYALVHNLVDARIHHRHILISLFGLWGLLFTGCFWIILQGKRKKTLLPDAVASFSISITFLTLLISYLASGIDSVKWLSMSAAYELAAASSYVFGIGNTFVSGWWIYACLASFLVSFIFGVRRGPAFSQNAFLGSLLVSVLLFPAIYLHGSSHGHGYGILAFAALGAFVGTLVGTGLASFILVLRRILIPVA